MLILQQARRQLHRVPFKRFQANLPERKQPPLPSVQDLNKRQTLRPRAAPAPLPPLTPVPAAPAPVYVPKLKHDRVSYDYPPPPPPAPVKPIQSRSVRRHLPLFIGSGMMLYLVYTVWYATTDHTEERTLTPDKFATYTLSHKHQLDKDHYLIELSPKSSGSWMDELRITKDTWDGSRIWSIELKQPEINVSRKYTPLPLYFLKDPDQPEMEPLLKITNEQDDTGRLVLYVKTYGQGEVARWLCSREVNSEIQIRGPFVEFAFPKHPLDDWVTKPKMTDLPSRIFPDTDLSRVIPADILATMPRYDNLAFYAAGTGIAPLLQVMLSPNPYKGFVDVHYSTQTASEIPVERFLFFLQKLDRIRVHHYINERDEHLLPLDIRAPQPRSFDPSVGDVDADKEALIQQRMAELKTGVKTGMKAEAKTEAKTEPTARRDDGVVHAPQKARVTAPPVEYQLSERFNTAVEQAAYTATLPKADPSLALVCGPEGYVKYVAGATFENEPHPMARQGPVKGLLGAKGWNEDNVYKL